MLRISLTALAAVSLAASAGAQDYHFTKEMAAGSRLSLDNINGAIEVTQGSGRVADIAVTKTVKKGDGSMVKAIMVPDGNGIRVCTIYLNENPNRNSCDGNNNNGSRDGDRFEVEMHYVVRVPAGVKVSAESVNGNVSVSGVDSDVHVETVNGNVDFQGATASSLETVNGRVHGVFANGTWDGPLHVETVNGAIDLAFPSSLSASVKGETVNGGISSPDFPLTIEGKWGPKSFSGKIGSGASRLEVSSVNGGITLRKQ